MPALHNTLETHKFGRLVIPGQEASPLPLQKTLVSGQITGPLSSVSVIQYFTNPFDRILELEYLFPLPQEAALSGFDIQIGKRTIHGDLQEIKEAREKYLEGRDAGRQTGLLEQRRPNLFSIKIANVLPKHEIRAVIHYEERLSFENGQFEFVFPMGLTPKYHTTGDSEEQQGVNSPIASADESIGPIEVNLSVDAGIPVKIPYSPSHPLLSTKLDPRRFTVQLGAPSIPDHDFVLRYQAESSEVSSAGWCCKGENGHFFLATLVPPVMAEEITPPSPREFIFVFDRSGSMSGEPIAQARNSLRACLRTLNPEDSFNILFFDDRMEWFQKETCIVSQKTIDLADAFLEEIHGRGGTEILSALDQALSLPKDSQNHPRFIIFLTDGAISAEERVLDQIRKRLSSERIFTFGIGPSVNRALLQNLARLGHGTAEFLQLDEDIEEAIIRFQDRVSYPLLTDIKVKLLHCKAWDQYPSHLPDLFLGQSIELIGRLMPRGSGTPCLELHALRNNSPINIQIDLPIVSRDPAVEHAWARARLDELLGAFASNNRNQKVRDEIIQLALEYGLITPFTSFVAVDDDVSLKPGEKPTCVEISQPLPKGLDIHGFMTASSPAMRMMAPPPAPGILPTPVSFARPLTQTAKVARHSLAEKNDAFIDGSKPELEPTNEPHQLFMSPENTLRMLVHTQNFNGSWNDDLETTSGALLAFIRQGHSSQAGLYRRQFRKALAWVLAHPLTMGFADFSRVLALQEIATSTQNEDLKEHFQSFLEKLPHPSLQIEQETLDLIHSKKPQIRAKQILSADDLRLAGLMRYQVDQPLHLPAGISELLAQIWWSCI